MAYQKDYLVRLMEVFFDALREIISNIEKNNIEDAKKQISDAYILLDADVDFFLTNNIESIYSHYDLSEKNIITKIRLVGELLHQDSKTETDVVLRVEKLEKSMEFLEHYQLHSKEYSLSIDNKLRVIKKELNELTK